MDLDMLRISLFLSPKSLEETKDKLPNQLEGSLIHYWDVVGHYQLTTEQNLDSQDYTGTTWDYS